MSLSGELVLLISSQLTVKPFSNFLGGGLCAGQDGQRNFPAFVSENKYRVIGWKGPKVIAYCSKNMGSIVLLSPPGAHQIWSI